MDAKNLEILRQLKQSRETAKDAASVKPRQKAHVPGQGFSEESEKIFLELAQKRIGAPAKSESPALPSPDQEDSCPAIDRVTREIRREFAAINKLVALQESADQKVREKEERRLTKAARRRERKAAKAAKVAKAAKKAPPSKKTKNPRPEQKSLICTAAPSIRPTSKWIERVCWRCKSKMVIHVEWIDPPGLCKPCRQYLKETHIPSVGRDRSIKFSYVHIVSGGAPSLGKRR